MKLEATSKIPRSGSFRNRILRAGTWSMGGEVVSQVIRLCGNLILTRLLIPEMFGVMAVVSLVMVGLTLFSDIGLRQNIIYSARGEEPRFLNTAWILQIIRGTFIFVMALLLSYGLKVAGQLNWLPTDTAYSYPILPELLAVISVTALIGSFKSTNVSVSNRKLFMGRLTLLEISSQVLGLIVMIVWAWLEQTIWALVGGTFVASISKVVLSHIIFPGPTNRFEWDTDAFHEIFHFGKWIFLTTLITFFLSWGDRLILGGLLSAKMLGIYTIAYFLANALKMALVKLSYSVLFPALSEIVRENPVELKKVYYKFRNKIDILIMIVAGFLMVSGETVIKILYDDRYSDAGWMLRVLSVSLIFVGPVLSRACFLAIGMSKYGALLTAGETLALYVSLPLSFSLVGLEGGIWAIAVAPIWMIPVTYWLMKKHELLDIRKEFVMTPVIIVGFVLGGIVNYLLEALLVS